MPENETQSQVNQATQNVSPIEVIESSLTMNSVSDSDGDLAASGGANIELV
jgi:hypothetical protein